MAHLWLVIRTDEPDYEEFNSGVFNFPTKLDLVTHLDEFVDSYQNQRYYGASSDNVVIESLGVSNDSIAHGPVCIDYCP